MLTPTMLEPVLTAAAHGDVVKLVEGMGVMVRAGGQLKGCSLHTPLVMAMVLWAWLSGADLNSCSLRTSACTGRKQLACKRLLRRC